MVVGTQKGGIKFMLFLFFLVGEQGIAMDNDSQEKTATHTITPANLIRNDAFADSQNLTQLLALPRLIIPHNPYAEEIKDLKTIPLSKIMGEDLADYINDDNDEWR